MGGPAPSKPRETSLGMVYGLVGPYFLLPLRLLGQLECWGGTTLPALVTHCSR